jgi:peroxiredoxin
VGQVAHANPGVSFVGVAAQDQVPAMQNFVAKYQLGFFPHLADVNASVWRHFGVTAQPAFAFVSIDGSVEVKNGLSKPDLAHRVGTLAAA